MSEETKDLVVLRAKVAMDRALHPDVFHRLVGFDYGLARHYPVTSVYAMFLPEIKEADCSDLVPEEMLDLSDPPSFRKRFL